ncbi:hypothetical protein Tsubulata_030599 [Turnera subulata]|uniref:RRM domain-containing protein n=1 Tax=Turnera subulata TaxID=218843 RepID=A0A9Q0J7H8_9ROSI|nr:hypothetical protein Tsubulata_030599 [Turnera subulata]
MSDSKPLCAPFLVQPMSPGLSGGYLPLPHPQPPPKSFQAATQSISHTKQTPPTNTNTPPANTNTSQKKTPSFFSKWSRQTIRSAIENNQVISFYVVNIPMRWLPTDLHLVMSKYGKVMDVFIPHKPNKSGARYAFVRFKNNIPSQTLICHINSIPVDGVSLAASVARNRGTPCAARPIHPSPSGLQIGNSNPVTTMNMKPFAEAVRFGNAAEKRDWVSPQPSPNQIFIPKNSNLDWLGRSALGVLKKPLPFSSLSAMAMTNMKELEKVIPIGGVSFLFTFNSADDLHSSLAKKPPVIDQLCSVFRAWKDGDGPVNRLCWVLIRGTPPGAWSKEFFQVVSARLGVMVDWSVDSMSMNRMDNAKILILTATSSFINCELSVSLGGTRFIIGVMETQYDPLEWEWSSLQPSGSATSGGAQMSNQIQVVQRATASSSRHCNTSVHSTAAPNQSPLSANSMSEDPFKLRPLIEKDGKKSTPRNQPIFYRSPTLLPSELSGHVPVVDSSDQSQTHQATLCTTTPQTHISHLFVHEAQNTTHSLIAGSPKMGLSTRPTDENCIELPLVPYPVRPSFESPSYRSPSPTHISQTPLDYSGIGQDSSSS